MHAETGAGAQLDALHGGSAITERPEPAACACARDQHCGFALSTCDPVAPASVGSVPFEFSLFPERDGVMTVRHRSAAGARAIGHSGPHPGDGLRRPQRDRSADQHRGSHACGDGQSRRVPEGKARAESDRAGRQASEASSRAVSEARRSSRAPLPAWRASPRAHARSASSRPGGLSSPRSRRPDRGRPGALRRLRRSPSECPWAT